MSGLIGLTLTGAAWAGGPSGQPIGSADDAADDANDRFIIKFRDRPGDPHSRLAALAGRSGRSLTYVRPMSGGAHVVRVAASAFAATAGRTPRELKRLLGQHLMLDPDVAYAEPDVKFYPAMVPNDPLYPQQWNFFEAAGGINLPAAWDVTTGSTGIVVAVLDTGIRPHPDLVNRTVPGYDFVSDANVSNDGDGRDADPSDPGDSCNGANSTWHGTHVAGIVGAQSNDGAGVAGVNWVSKILPARVLGTCGGYTSDVVDAIRWAAGIALDFLPANPNPARVENLSFTAREACSDTIQSAIDDVVGRGTVVVVAAGNDTVDAARREPAGCNNVIAVGGTLRDGGRSRTSNYGSRVALSAPGESVLSTSNAGTTTPGADSYALLGGTSVSAPHVAGVAALMLGINPALSPAQVKARLQASARTFPSGTSADCTAVFPCGAGIVDAAAAVAAAAQISTRPNLTQTSGTTAVASSIIGSLFSPLGAIDGEHRGANWNQGGAWAGFTSNYADDELQIRFNGYKTVGEIDVFTLQDSAFYSTVPVTIPAEPTEATTFSVAGLTAFDVQYWRDTYLPGTPARLPGAWVTVPGGHVVGNDKVLTKFTFPPVTTTTLRVLAHQGMDGVKRIVEVEAYNDAGQIDLARPANGGRATASSVVSADYPASAVIDGDRLGLNWGRGGGWAGATANGVDDELQVGFDAYKLVGEIDVFTLQDGPSPVDPTLDTTFTRYGLTDFDVQLFDYTDGWVTVPGGQVVGNNKVWRKFTFPPVRTTTIRVLAHRGADGIKRLVEVEASLGP